MAIRWHRLSYNRKKENLNDSLGYLLLLFLSFVPEMGAIASNSSIQVVFYFASVRNVTSDVEKSAGAIKAAGTLAIRGFYGVCASENVMRQLYLCFARRKMEGEMMLLGCCESFFWDISPHVSRKSKAVVQDIYTHHGSDERHYNPNIHMCVYGCLFVCL